MSLDNAQYLSLSTRKRDGSRVETPVWFAQQQSVIFIFSEGDAGKIKRIRNFADVKLSPCTVTGKITGESIDGTAKILTDAKDIQKAHQALVKKYGWQMRLLDMGSALVGKKKKRAFVRIDL